MEMTVTGRHMDITPSIREYSAKKLDHIGIDFPRVLSAHYILEVDKFRHIAELVLQCGNHLTIEARGVSEDLYASIDSVVDKATRQMRKYKTKMQRHRPRKAALYHVDEQVLDGKGQIDPDKLATIGRMGGSLYSRTKDRFEMERPE